MAHRQTLLHDMLGKGTYRMLFFLCNENTPPLRPLAASWLTCEKLSIPGRNDPAAKIPAD